MEGTVGYRLRHISSLSSFTVCHFWCYYLMINCSLFNQLCMEYWSVDIFILLQTGWDLIGSSLFASKTKLFWKIWSKLKSAILSPSIQWVKEKYSECQTALTKIRPNSISNCFHVGWFSNSTWLCNKRMHTKHIIMILSSMLR